MKLLTTAEQYLNLIESGDNDRVHSFQLSNLAEMTRPSFHKAMLALIKKREPHMYMVTFTLKPDCPFTREQNEEFLRKQARRTCWGKIHKCIMVHELTKKGADHWHMAFSVSKIMKTCDFNGWNSRGFKKLDKNRVNSFETMQTYLEKANTPEVLV